MIASKSSSAAISSHEFFFVPHVTVSSMTRTPCPYLIFPTCRRPRTASRTDILRIHLSTTLNHTFTLRLDDRHGFRILGVLFVVYPRLLVPREFRLRRLVCHDIVQGSSLVRVHHVTRDTIHVQGFKNQLLIEVAFTLVFPLLDELLLHLIDIPLEWFTRHLIQASFHLTNVIVDRRHDVLILLYPPLTVQFRDIFTDRIFVETFLHGWNRLRLRLRRRLGVSQNFLCRLELFADGILRILRVDIDLHDRGSLE